MLGRHMARPSPRGAPGKASNPGGGEGVRIPHGPRVVSAHLTARSATAWPSSLFLRFQEEDAALAFASWAATLPPLQNRRQVGPAPYPAPSGTERGTRMSGGAS
jgi:hypothetical protein